MSPLEQIRRTDRDTTSDDGGESATRNATSSVQVSPDLAAAVIGLTALLDDNQVGLIKLMSVLVTLPPDERHALLRLTRKHGD